MIGRLVLLCALAWLVIASARTEPVQVGFAQQVTSTPTRTPTGTASPLPSVTPTATINPTVAASATVTVTATATVASTASRTPTPTSSRIPTPTTTPIVPPTPSPTTTRTPTATATISPTRTGTATVTSTPVAPIASAIAVSSITRSGATISWTTNVPSTSQVDYGSATPDAAHTLVDPSLVTAHRVVLTGLLPGTTYRYRVRSATTGGASVGVSTDAILATAPAGSGPDITSLSVRQVTGSTATIDWVTSTGTVAQVEYGVTASYGSFTLLKIFGEPSQEMLLTGLRPATLYHFRVNGWDGSGFLSASADSTFVTAPAGQATLLGDQTIQTEHLALPVGQARAYQYAATQSGQATVVRVFVDPGTTTPVLRVALYSDQDGVPGSILSQGSAPALVPGWITVTIPPAPLLQSSRYWFAVLSPIGAGNLNLREALSGGSSLSSAQTTLAAFPQTWTSGQAGARSPLSLYVQQVPPAITLTGPADGAIATGLVPLSAVVDDDTPLTRFEFLVDGLPVGPQLIAPPYTLNWDSNKSSASLPHTIAARAIDVLGRTGASATVTVQVDNGPLIANVFMSPGLTVSSARISWSTDVLADAQVEFGATPAYGSSTPVDARPDRRHEMQLTGLLPGAIYHYRVISRDANGAAAVSADQVFFTPDF